MNKTTLFSLISLVILCVLSMAAPLVEHLLGVSATETDLFNRLQPASPTHLLGTDELGRDFLTRLLYGGRISLIVGVTAALAATLIGTAIGLAAGLRGGVSDTILMRFTDFIIALPILPLLIIMTAIDMTYLGFSEDFATREDTSLYRIILLISLFGWTTVARLVRARTLSLREADFITAAYALGQTTPVIAIKHILPNVFGTITVATTLTIGNIILVESVLSFLGLGIQPPLASWGNLLTTAQDSIWESKALAFWPGMLIFITVLAFNFLGDGLQDVLDPKETKKDQAANS